MILMPTAVRECQCRTPGSSKDSPFIYAHHAAQLLNILHEVPGGILIQTQMGRGTAAAPLIKQENAPLGQIEEF
jgi:hypothetical protein